MKKTLAILMLAGLTLLACTKEAPVTTDASGPLAFNLSVTHPQDTKAVKTAWEDGDVVFVFFSEAEAPRYLEMEYDAGNKTWIQTPKNGTAEESFSLTGGTMTAVYLPFGNSAEVVADGNAFTFDKTYYRYYFVASKQPYTVSGGVVSGNLYMTLPDGYVQFFIEDESPVDGAYALGTDAVIPVGVASIDKDGNVVETSDKDAGNDMVGYAYEGGYLFSGKLNGSYHSYVGDGISTVEANAYYFAKTKKADNTRADYFVSGKTLTRHSAIKLPANGNAKWQAVGSGIYYELKDIQDAGTAWEQEIKLGKWYTCNYGCRVPEQLGTLYTFDDANALTGITLPTKAQFEKLSTTGVARWIWLSVHGQQGMVVQASNAFLFLPAQYGTNGYGMYWSSTERDSDSAWYFDFKSRGTHGVNFMASNGDDCPVRPFQN